MADSGAFHDTLDVVGHCQLRAGKNPQCTQSNTALRTADGLYLLELVLLAQQVPHAEQLHASSVEQSILLTA